MSKMRVLVTGANGFIGKNLVVRLRELSGYEVLTFVRGHDVALLPGLVAQADAIIHLAGENRPVDEKAFADVNAGLTLLLCDAIRKELAQSGRKVSLLFASSTQAERDNPYGRSKRAAELAVEALAQATQNPAVVFRLPGVFGKWCKPNYNSVVTTFCYNIARDLPIQVNDPAAVLRLVYIDDVVSAFIDGLLLSSEGFSWGKVLPEYSISLGELAGQIRAFKDSRDSLMIESVGDGLVRALYSTFVSCLPNEQFCYEIPLYGDERGVFAEMIKTPDCGQFSFFTVHPGVTRGGHYHHTKTEKFLVVRGQAQFRFRHLLTNELVDFITTADRPVVVDTIPGWAHDITNIGEDDLIVTLWANEVFDRDHPDTIAFKV